MNKIFTKGLLALLLGSFISIKAQQKSTHIGHNPKSCGFKGQMIFDKDSLVGFDELIEWEKAIKQGYDVSDQKVVMAILKRNFIDFKYGYKQMYMGGANQVQTGCTNVDFEAGNISGWTAVQGDNINSSTHQMGTLSATTQTLICNPGYVDPNGVPITGTSPLGGKFLRLGKTSLGGTAYKISQTFTVTAANSVFIYAYAVVLEDGSHSCSQQPYFNIAFKDCNGNAIPCGQYDVIAGGSACSTGVDPTFITSGSFSYKQWTTAAFDLSSQIGSCVTIDFQVAGCVIAQGAHAGYCYIDASCQPMSMTLNGTQIPVGQTNNSFCGASTTNTLCAPAGFNYTWTGPGVTGQTGQCINTSSIGTFSVTLAQSGASCFSPVLYSTFNSVPNPTVTASITQPVCATPVGTATINVNGGTAPYTFSWTPSQPSNQVNTNLPPTSSYTVLVEDDNGCLGTTSFSVNGVPGGPSYSLSTVPGLNLSCASPSTTITFAPTSTNTSVFWGGPQGVITGTNVVVTSPGTYTYAAINTVSTCSLTGSVVITSDVNIPTATYSVACNTNSVTLSAVAASSLNLSWAEPGNPSGSLSNPLTSTAAGVFTLTVTDPSNGCVQTYTTLTSVPPISIATTPSSNVITCANQTVSATASSSPSTTITWDNGASTSTNNPYSISSSGTYTVTAQNSIGCSTQSVVTVTTNTAVNVNINAPVTIIPCSTGSVALNASSTVGGPYTYVWSPSTPSYTGAVFTATSAATYSVVALNTANGCTATATQGITYDNITASFNASVYQGLLPLSVTFTNTSLGVNPAGTNYSWDFGNGTVLASNAATVSTIYNQQGYFPVVLTATSGFCQDTAVRYIRVDVISSFAVPNVFTPNGDGKNDFFTFDAVNMGEVNVTIYDRWGLKMFETTGTGNVSWDGKNKGGSIVSDGTYFYIIKATGLDAVKYDLKGTVNVFQ